MDVQVVRFMQPRLCYAMYSSKVYQYCGGIYCFHFQLCLLLPWLLDPEDVEAARSPERMVNFYQTTQCNIPRHFLLTVAVVHIKMFSLLVHSNEEYH